MFKYTKWIYPAHLSEFKTVNIHNIKERFLNGNVACIMSLELCIRYRETVLLKMSTKQYKLLRI